MYKFKYKAQNEEPQTFYFKTMQEVFNYIYLLCDSDKIEDILKVQKEYNIKFYISKKAN
jgi:hypothetical protein